MRDKEKTLGNLISKQSSAIITSIDEDGYPNTKAMLAPRKVEGIKTFYFTTNTSSIRVSQYQNNPKASIYFMDKRFFRGVMFIGKMEVLHDHETKASIWQTGDTMYYKEGVDDPDYCVLRFTAEKGRYYQNFKSEDFTIE